MLTRFRQFVPAPLRRLRRRLVGPSEPNYGRLWRSACQQWLPGSLEVRDGVAEFTGWAVVPESRRRHVTFMFNDTEFPAVEFPNERPELAAFLPFVADARRSGFYCTAPAAALPAGPVALRCADERTGRDLGPQYRPWFINNTTEDAVLPERNRRDRVIGVGIDFNYRAGGYTAFRRLGEALRGVTGRDFADYPRVLDWGSGCGRVSRYLQKIDGVQLTGVDVDPDNVAWAGANLPGGDYQTIPLRPPTGLPAESFDCVIGLSVLTHLREADQFLWLEELRRVTRPGGVLLLTFHGRGSLAWTRPGADLYARLRRDGITDVPDRLYDAGLPEADYYRSTYHTEAYVRREWGKYFRVLKILYHNQHHQDLAVLRRE